MRKRLRDWPITVYKYGAYLPNSSTPTQGLADEAVAMQAMWAHLLERETERQHRYQEILAESPAVADAQLLVEQHQQTLTDAQTALKAARQRVRKRQVPDLEILTAAIARAKIALSAAYAEAKAARTAARDAQREKLTAMQEQYDAERRHLRSTIKTVDGGNREFILDKFSTASRQARKTGAHLRVPQGFPTEINYAHLFTSGWPVARLFAGSSNKVSFGEGSIISPRLGRGDTIRCHFLVRGEPLAFDVFYHRPLPHNALIKSVILHGELVRRAGFQESKRDGQTYRVNARWKWSLLVTCETPPSATTDIPARSCGVDVGYRLMPDGGLRVAYLMDNDGRSEELRLPPEMIARLRNQWEYQSRADTLREKVTEHLKTLPVPRDLSPEGRRLLTQQIGFPGLRALYREVAACEPCEMQEHLRQWMVASSSLYFRVRGMQRALVGWRKTVYRKWAYALCQRYTQFAIEALDVKELGMGEKESLGHGEVGKYRQFAAVGELLSILMQMTRKYGRTCERRDPAHTTVTCPVCQAITSSDRSALMLTCPNGHRYDQDRGAAINLQAPPHNAPEILPENVGA